MAGVGRILSIGSIINNKDRFIFNRYVPGSGVGANSTSVRRAKINKASLCKTNCIIKSPPGLEFTIYSGYFEGTNENPNIDWFRLAPQLSHGITSDLSNLETSTINSILPINMSLKLSGLFLASKTGLHTFSTTSDDISFLYINGVPVVYNGERQRQGEETYYGNYNMIANNYYKINIYYGKTSSTGAFSSGYIEPNTYEVDEYPPNNTFKGFLLDDETSNIIEIGDAQSQSLQTSTRERSFNGYVVRTPETSLKYEIYSGYFNDNLLRIENSGMLLESGYTTDLTDLQTSTNGNFGTNINNKSLKISGFFKAQYTGDYSFFTKSNASSYLLIDDELLINNITSGSLLDNTINMIADQFYKIDIYYGIGTPLQDPLIPEFTAGFKYYNSSSITNASGLNVFYQKKILNNGFIYEAYNGYFNNNVNWFDDAVMLERGYTNDLTNLQTSTNGYFKNDLTSKNKSLKIYGYFKAKSSGYYRLFITNNNESYLFVNDNLLIKQMVYNKIKMFKGEYYKIEIYTGFSSSGTEIPNFSAGIDFVKAYPPLAFESNNNLNINNLDLDYGNGTYSISSSSDYDVNTLSFNAFNNNQISWNCADNSYDPVTGKYLGTSGELNQLKTTKTAGGDISGEWIEIKLPSPIKLDSFLLKSLNETASQFLLRQNLIVTQYDGNYNGDINWFDTAPKLVTTTNNLTSNLTTIDTVTNSGFINNSTNWNLISGNIDSWTGTTVTDYAYTNLAASFNAYNAKLTMINSSDPILELIGTSRPNIDPATNKYIHIKYKFTTLPNNLNDYLQLYYWTNASGSSQIKGANDDYVATYHYNKFTTSIPTGSINVYNDEEIILNKWKIITFNMTNNSNWNSSTYWKSFRIDPIAGGSTVIELEYFAVTNSPIPPNSKSLKVSGYFRPQKSGIYKFFTNSNYKNNLIIDGSSIVQNNGEYIEKIGTTKSLIAGNNYPFTLYYGPHLGSSELKYPPISILSNNQTLGNLPYGNGTYNILYSSLVSQAAAPAGWKVFDNNMHVDSEWRSNTVKYAGGTGIVTPSAAGTNIYNTNSTTYTGIYGEWVQIQLPYKIALKKYTMYSIDSKEIYLLGSNNTNDPWYKLDVYSNTPINTTNTRTLNSTNSYIYYRLVVTIKNSGNTYCSLREWGLYEQQYLSCGYLEPNSNGTVNSSNNTNIFTKNATGLTTFYDNNVKIGVPSSFAVLGRNGTNDWTKIYDTTNINNLINDADDVWSTNESIILKPTPTIPYTDYRFVVRQCNLSSCSINEIELYDTDNQVSVSNASGLNLFSDNLGLSYKIYDGNYNGDINSHIVNKDTIYEFPPLGLFTYENASLTTKTILKNNMSYGNGTYIIRSSSTNSNNGVQKAFDNRVSTSWQSSQNKYNPLSATIGVTQVVNRTDISGEWIDIQLPYRNTLDSFIAIVYYNSPIVVVGNNNINDKWNIIYETTSNITTNKLYPTSVQIEPYSNYRLIILISPNTNTYTGVSEWKLYESSAKLNNSIPSTKYPPIAIDAALQIENTYSDSIDKLKYMIYDGYFGGEDATPNITWFGTATMIASGYTSNLSTLASATHNNNMFGDVDNRSLKLSGYFRAKKTGTYTFFTTSDDASFLYINDRPIVLNGGVHAAQTRFGVFPMSVGSFYKFDIYYGESVSGQEFSAGYYEPDLTEIPSLPLTGDITTLTDVLYSGDYTLSSSSTGATVTARFRAFNKSMYSDDRFESSGSLYGDIINNIGGYYRSYGTSTTTLTNSTIYRGEWLQIELPQPIQIKHFKLARRSSTGATSLIDLFTFFGTNDPSTGWFKLYEKTSPSLTFWGYNNFEVKSFDVATNINEYKYYRLAVNRTQSNSAFGLGEFLLYTEIPTTDTTKYIINATSEDVFKSYIPSFKIKNESYGNGHYIVSSSSSVGDKYDYQAFDYTSKYWRSNSTYDISGSYNGQITTQTTIGDISGEWLQIEFPKPISLHSFFMNARDITIKPKNMKILGSNNINNHWIIVYENQNIVYPAVTGETFKVEPMPSKTYKFYRLVILSTEGGNSYTEITEWRLYEPNLYNIKTSNLSTLSTMTGNILKTEDNASKTVTIDGYFRSRITGTHTFGIIAESLDNPTYEGTGPYPATIPAVIITLDCLFIYNFRLNETSTGVITEIGSAENSSAITIYDEADIKKIQIIHYKSETGAFSVNNEYDISKYLNTDIQLVLYVNRNPTNTNYDVKIIMNNELIGNYIVSTSQALAGNNQATIGGLDNVSPNSVISPLSLLKSITNYSSPIYSHKLWYNNSLPTADAVKADLYINETLVVDKNNGTYDFQPLEGTISLTAGQYYPFKLVLGKKSVSYFNVNFTEPDGNKVSNDEDTLFFRKPNQRLLETEKEYPPLAASSNKTEMLSIKYGNGDYIMRASSIYNSSHDAWRSFNKIFNDVNDAWRSDSNKYDISNGLYSGTSTTNVLNQGTINGEWLEIILPEAIGLDAFTLTARNSDVNIGIGKEIYIVGSNITTDADTVTGWEEVYHIEDTGQWGINETKRFITTNKKQYRRFRYISHSIQINKDFACVGEWVLYKKLNVNVTDNNIYLNQDYLKNQIIPSKIFNKDTSDIDFWCIPDKYNALGVHDGSITTLVEKKVIPGQWLEIELPSPIQLDSFTLTSINSSEMKGYPKEIYIVGSNTKVGSWRLIYYSNNVGNWSQHEIKRFTSKNKNSYKYFRYIVVSTHNFTYTALAEWMLYGVRGNLPIVYSGLSYII